MFRRMRGTSAAVRCRDRWPNPKATRFDKFAFAGTSLAQIPRECHSIRSLHHTQMGKAPDRSPMWRIRRQMRPIRNGKQKQ